MLYLDYTGDIHQGGLLLFYIDYGAILYFSVVSKLYFKVIGLNFTSYFKSIA